MSAAASSSSFPSAFNTGISSRDTNGKVTNIVASTTPGSAKTIFMSVPKKALMRSMMPDAQPSLPNVMRNASPAMTGEMENGISISVAKNCFPLKENFVSSQDAAIPKKVLTATAQIVARNVTFKADRTYSVERDSK